MQFTVYGPLRGATGAKTVTVEGDPETVADAIDAFVEAHPGTDRYLYDDGGSLRPSVRVTVDGDRADPSDPCPPDAGITLMPAVQGG